MGCGLIYVVIIDVENITKENYMNIPEGFGFLISIIIILILISIQFTLNLILKELRAIKNNPAWYDRDKYKKDGGSYE